MIAKKSTLQTLILTALFAAIIYIGTLIFNVRTPIGMVHIGNALVVVSFLVLGTRHSAMAAAIGFGIYDLLNGYGSVAWRTILESVIIVFILGFVYKKMELSDTKINVYVLSALAGFSKVVIIFIRYVIVYALAGDSVPVLSAATRLPNSILTAFVTAIAAPLIYFTIKKTLPQIIQKKEETE